MNKKSASAGSKTPRQVPVVERREFYKEAKGSLVKLAATSVACLVATLGLTFYNYTQASKNVYFASTDDGRLVKMVALSTPNQKDANVTAWVQEAIIDTFDVNFHNMKRSINNASMKWFTAAGGEALIESLQNEGYFETITKNKLVVSFAPMNTPIITRKFLSDAGKYTWHVELDGILTYRTQSKVYTDKVVFTLEVQRISLREDPKGMGISKIILRKK